MTTINSNVTLPKEEQRLYSPPTGSAGYNGLYTKFYSSSDFKFYIGDILIDRASGIGLNENLSSSPIYTIGNSRYDFLARGNLIVTGYISINKSHKDYLARVLVNYREGLVSKGFKSLSAYEQLQLTHDELISYKEKERAFLDQKISHKTILDCADFPEFTLHMVYDNSDPISSGIQQRISIIECRIVGYEHAVDISSDGQLIDGYKFIAKEVVPE